MNPDIIRELTKKLKESRIIQNNQNIIIKEWDFSIDLFKTKLDQIKTKADINHLFEGISSSIEGSEKLEIKFEGDTLRINYSKTVQNEFIFSHISNVIKDIIERRVTIKKNLDQIINEINHLIKEKREGIMGKAIQSSIDELNKKRLNGNRL